jgi:hypothetical protein
MEQGSDGFHGFKPDLARDVSGEPAVECPALERKGKGAQYPHGKFRPCFQGGGFEPVIFGSEDLGGGQQIPPHGGSEKAFEFRDQLEPDPVPGGSGVCVGGVLAKREVLLFREGLEFAAPDLEHGSAEKERSGGMLVGVSCFWGAQGLNGAHSGQAAGAGAAQESCEQGLGLVIGVVGEKDVGRTGARGGLGVEGVSGGAAGGFQGDMPGTREVGDGDTLGEERHGEL